MLPDSELPLKPCTTTLCTLKKELPMKRFQTFSSLLTTTTFGSVSTWKETWDPSISKKWKMRKRKDNKTLPHSQCSELTTTLISKLKFTLVEILLTKFFHSEVHTNMPISPSLKKFSSAVKEKIWRQVPPSFTPSMPVPPSGVEWEFTCPSARKLALDGLEELETNSSLHSTSTKRSTKTSTSVLPTNTRQAKMSRLAWPSTIPSEHEII